MEHIGVKLFIPYVNASARDGLWVSLNLREVCLDLEWIMAEGVNGVAT